MKELRQPTEVERKVHVHTERMSDDPIWTTSEEVAGRVVHYMRNFRMCVF
jgi:hypothetical protein